MRPPEASKAYTSSSVSVVQKCHERPSPSHLAVVVIPKFHIAFLSGMNPHDPHH